MPTQKFGRESVLDAALNLVRERGYESLSARAVAEQAGCSVQPIYSLFGDMGGLMEALYDYALRWVTSYNQRFLEEAPNVFAANGRAHLRLAREEPQLFTFLYLSPYLKAHDLDELYASVTQPGVQEFIQERGESNADAAHGLYLNMIVYSHGLASMLAVGASFSDEEIAKLMNGAFFAFAAQEGVKTGGEGR